MPEEALSLLLVDDRTKVSELLDAALGEIEIAFSSVPSIAKAKQSLVSKTPSLLVSNTKIENDETAGFRLCKDLRSHPMFESLPVLLFSAGVTQIGIQEASNCGASGLLDLTSPPERVRKRILRILGIHDPREAVAESVQQPAVVASQAAAAPQRAPATSQPASRESAVSQEDSEQEASLADKLKKAQHLLALVLHNLKTSNLLEVVDLEDVNGVVLQMARTVCGESAAARTASARPDPADQESQKKRKDRKTEVNIDEIFSR